MGKEEIISYVMETPGNTNPNVLRSLLDGEASSNKFIVTLTLTSETGGTTDKSNKEIAEAFNEGKQVWFTGIMNGMNGTFPLTVITQLSHTYPFIGTRFDMINTANNQISSAYLYMVGIEASDEENYIFEMRAFELTPVNND